MLLSTLQIEDRVLNSFDAILEIIQSHSHEITSEEEDNGMPTFNLFLELSSHGTLADLIKKEPFLETVETKIYNIAMLLRGIFVSTVSKNGSFLNPTPVSKKYCRSMGFLEEFLFPQSPGFVEELSSHGLHRKGIVHCDFKPHNILVFPGGYYNRYNLKIAEFGKARVPEENFDPGLWRLKFRGTSWYMSPESFVHGLIEAPLDIWSFGCVVIEMITGRNAWGIGLSESDIKVKIGITQEPPNLPNGISEGCYDLLTKCLVIDPNQRWTADMLLKHPYLLEVLN